MSHPKCKCIDKINERLNGREEELVLAFERNSKNDIVGIPIVETQRRGTKRYARGGTALLPNFCPFCGKPYVGCVRVHLSRRTTRRIGRAPVSVSRP